MLLKKTQFSPLGVNFTSTENSKKWPEYTIKVIYGLNIFFFRKGNKIIMRDFAILFTEYVLSSTLQITKLNEKIFFPSYNAK